MVHHIAVGIDGSEESLAAADWAAQESLGLGVPLTLVHAWESERGPTAPPTAPEGTAQQWAGRLLEEVASEITARHPGLEVGGEQVPGPPVEVLLDAGGQAELLVLGSRGLGGVAGFLLGSVSQRTVARAVRPVVMVRAGWTAEDGHLPAPDGRASTGTARREVVLGVDVREPSDAPVRFAFEVADRWSAPLHVVHAWDFPPAYGYAAGPVDPEINAELAEAERRLLSTVLRPWRQKYPDVQVREHVVVGPPAHHLVRASLEAGLVVVGRRARSSAVGPQIGHVAHAVLHHVRAPVAVVPHP